MMLLAAAEQQDPVCEPTVVNLQQNSSVSSGMALLSETERNSTRMLALSGKIRVCTFLPVEAFEEQSAAVPEALFAVMHPGSQLRSIWRPLTFPPLPVRYTQTSVGVPCAAANCAETSSAATMTP
jgi:hypothetical protein